MTTKTIAAYLEDERQKHTDDQLRMEKETARIQSLHHGHHRTAKQPAVEFPSLVEAASKQENLPQHLGSSHAPRAARKTATRARKMA
jgi:hypothetical protein